MTNTFTLEGEVKRYYHYKGEKSSCSFITLKVDKVINKRNVSGYYDIVAPLTESLEEGQVIKCTGELGLKKDGTNEQGYTRYIVVLNAFKIE